MRQTVQPTAIPPQWQLQTAKAQLSALIEAALRGEPQRITRRGKDAVMVVSEESFLALKRSARHDAGDFVLHLLATPRERPSKKPTPAATPTKTQTSRLRLRDIEV